MGSESLDDIAYINQNLSAPLMQKLGLLPTKCPAMNYNTINDAEVLQYDVITEIESERPDQLF